MKIVKLTTENIKKITAVEITPTGSLVKISGKNAQGKTSLLDSIWWALGGASNIQDKPIRKGQSKARVKIELDDLIIERKFTAKGSTLSVTNKDGTKHTSPQSVIDSLVGKMTFDPLAFMRMNTEAQFKSLASLCGLTEVMAKSEDEYATIYSRRTEINKVIHGLKSTLANTTLTEPVEFVDVARLTEELEEADRNRVMFVRQTDKLAALKRRREETNTTKKILLQQLEEAESKLSENKVEGRACVKILADLSGAVDKYDEVVDAVSTAQATNQRASDHTVYTERVKELNDAQNKSTDLSDKLVANKEALRKFISDTTMPIKGIGFSDDGKITYNLLPLSQASAAEQLKISTAIAMSDNPELRIIRITDASLLDDDSLKVVEKMAKKHDYQVWLECVDSTGKVGFYIEDGAVVEEN